MYEFNSMNERLIMAAKSYPDKMAVKDLEHRLSYKELNERACCLANGLSEMGIEKGDRVAIIAHNRIEWIEVLCAALKSGFVVVPLLFRFVPDEYQYIVEDSACKAFIIGPGFVEGAISIRDRISNDLANNYIYLDDKNAPSGILYEDIIRKSPAKEPDVDISGEDLWCINYTSGSTGNPKGVVRTHRSWIAHHIMTCLGFGFDQEERALLVMPLGHANSIIFTFAILYVHGSVTFYNKVTFDPEGIIKAVQEDKTTFTSLVPTQYIMILSLPEEIKKKYDVSSMRTILCSSAPLRRSTKLDIVNYFSGVRFFEGFGSTEQGVIVLLNPEDQMRKFGSVGREIIGCRPIKILDEKRRELPSGETGEIFSTQACGMSEYWNAPDYTKKAFHGEYITAGDVGYKDDEGFIFLVDRKANMIITGGENVYPSEVEKVVVSHELVKEVAVIGVPDEKWGESIKAIVVLESGIKGTEKLKEELLLYCRERMAGYKRPKSIEFIKDDEIPRTATGKIVYGSLRDRFGRWSDEETYNE
jgi:fatty-acyl-CoA synthase